MPPRKRAAKKTAAKKPHPTPRVPAFPLPEGGYLSTSAMPKDSTSRGAAVSHVRHALGLHAGMVFDDETRHAVIAFQKAAGLPVTGVVTQEDWEALFASSASATGADAPASAGGVDGADEADDAVVLDAPEGAQ